MTLKNNKEQVDEKLLKTKYLCAYQKLQSKIQQTGTAYVKKIVLENLLINPDEGQEEQLTVINQVIAESGLMKEISRVMFKQYDIMKVHSLALELRSKIEAALYPYIAQKDCLVVDMIDPEQEPVIYNILTRKVFENERWVEREIELYGKLLVFLKQDNFAYEKTEDNVNEDCEPAVES